MSREKTKKITSIGGSALIEGIMMRGPKKTTVAVRMGKDDIYTEDISFTGLTQKHKFCRLPLIRGVCGLVDSMRLSYKSLMISADKAIEAGEIESSLGRSAVKTPTARISSPVHAISTRQACCRLKSRSSTTSVTR